MRQEVDEKSEAHRPEQELQSSDHQRQDDGQAHVVRSVLCRQGSDAGGNQERDHRHGAHGQLPRRAEQGIPEEWDQRRIQSVDGRKPGDERVGHALGYQHHADRDSGRDVMFQVAGAVCGQPRGRWEDAPDKRFHRESPG